MNHSISKRILYYLGAVLFLFGTLGASPAIGGEMRITMVDGNQVNVEYCWEENQMIRFQVPGGHIGIPKSQVASIQEVITEQEFNPKALVLKTGTGGTMQQRLEKKMDDTIAKLDLGYKKLSKEEIEKKLLEIEGAGMEVKPVAEEKFYQPLFELKGDFGELVQLRENGVTLVMKSVLTSLADFQDRSFTLTLFDGKGNILQQKPVQPHPIEVRGKERVELGVAGRLFTLVATVTPDPEIRRYSITTTPVRP